MAFLEHLLATNLSSLLGGALIGIAATGLLLLNGRIAGVSGIAGGLADPKPHGLGWRIAFTLGLLAGGFIALAVDPQALGLPPENRPIWLLAVSGLLIGLGTGLAHGCTSGHGICGLARRSKRSLAATVAFMISGMLTATLYAHWQGEL